MCREMADRNKPFVEVVAHFLDQSSTFEPMNLHIVSALREWGGRLDGNFEAGACDNEPGSRVNENTGLSAGLLEVSRGTGVGHRSSPVGVPVSRLSAITGRGQL